ncbi:MAG: ATP-dependent protease ATPase subunit HslU, partial [Candidatus Dormiibacterota bacterium]
RAVAVAIRNRWRRQQLEGDMRQEVAPKNIMMIGPTGVGKTEIARRVARLTESPFIKVEATKFTEVGYVGRDVESIVRDLLEQTITELHEDRIAEVEPRARELADARLLETLVEADLRQRASRRRPEDGEPGAPEAAAEARRRRERRRRLARRLAAGSLENANVEIEVEEPFQPAFEGFTGTGLEEVGVSLSDFFSQLAPPRKRKKLMPISEARDVLVDEETDRLIDMDRVYDDSIRLVEDSGVVFIDEVDKICGPASDRGPDVSGEGVQRDLLPILEGSTVHTRYGPVRTDHVLFIAAGAFTAARPSDLIPEFQGRFPIRVELKPLSEDDLVRILTEPGNALTRQYAALLGTERVTLDFTPDGIRELAAQAYRVNEEDENLGARRLFTIMEKVLEDVSFEAEDLADTTVVIDGAYVTKRLGDLVGNQELRRYVL